MQVCRVLATVGGGPAVLEVVGSSGHVEHRLALPAAQAVGIAQQMQAVIPGLAIQTATDRPELNVAHGVEVRLSTRRRPLRTDDIASTNRAILTALAGARRDERLAIQWLLGRSLAPVAVPNQLVGWDAESWLGASLLAPFTPPRAADPEARSALRDKQAAPAA